MKLLVGLGNPGEKYKNNRHNVGHRFIRYLLRQGIDERETMLAMTKGFMNRSGEEIKKLLDNWKLGIENLVVVHDDLDIPLGKFKIHYGSPKLHNGIQSVEKSLGTKDFLRVRIGVENRNDNNKLPGEAYVLQDFMDEEKRVIRLLVFPKALERLNQTLNTKL